MCLQWCHVRHILINNDFPCSHCPSTLRLDHSTRGGCDTCRHRHENGSAEFCRLTHADLPPARSCCHHNVNLDEGVVVITLPTIAPTLLEEMSVATVAEVFLESDTAPDVPLPDPNAVTVDLALFAIPAVYGIPSTEWKDVPFIPDNDAYGDWLVEALVAIPIPADVPPLMRYMLDQFPHPSLTTLSTSDVPAEWATVVYWLVWIVQDWERLSVAQQSRVLSHLTPLCQRVLE